MKELKPCPFCGGEAFSYSIAPHTHELAKFMPDHPGSGFVECRGCSASMSGDSEAEAIAAWNRRAQPESEPLTLDELRQMDGEPVWVKEITEEPIDGNYWGIVDIDVACAGGYGVGAIISQATDGRSGAAQTVFLDYAKTWIAYRTKPESEDN